MSNRIILSGFMIALVMTSCIVYAPQTADIPLISEKKELRIDAGISVIPAAQATISYGLTDKIAIQTYGSIGTDERYYFQGAAGLYKNLGNQRVMELYGGFGYGHGNAYKDSNPGHLFGNYQLYFLQYNYGKIASESSNFEIGFGIKSGFLRSNLTDENYYKRTTEAEPYDNYIDNSFLIEPTGFIRIGSEKLKFSLKLGSSWMYKFTNTDKNLPYSYINLSLGINYRLK